VNLFAGKALGPIARKIGLVPTGVSKRVLKGLILKKLVDLKVPEPIRRKVATKRTRDQSVATNQSLATGNAANTDQPPANGNANRTNQPPANGNRVRLNEPELNFRPNGTAEFLNRETVGNKTFVVPEGASKMTFPKMARVNSAQNFEALNLGKHRALSFSGATGRMGSVNRNGINFRIPNIKFPAFGSPKKNLKIPTFNEKNFNVPEPPQLIEARRELEQTRAAAGPQNPMTQELELKVREMEKKQSPQATGAGAGNGNRPVSQVPRASGNGNRTTAQVPRGNGNRPVSQVSGNGNALQKVKNEANAERRRIESNAARARANLEANARRVQNNLKEQLSGAKNANKALEIQARLEKNKINLETKKAELEARTERNKAALAARVAERQANVNLRKAEMAARAASASGRSGPSLWNKVRNMVKKKPGGGAPAQFTREDAVRVLMEAGASRAQINEVRTSGNFRQVVERLAQGEEAQGGEVMGFPVTPAQTGEIMQNAGATQNQINAVQASPNPTTTNRAKKAWAAFRKKAPPANKRFLVGGMFSKKNLRNIFALPKNKQLSNQNVYLLKEMYGSRNKLVGPWKNFASLKANYERLKAPKKESLENLLKRNNVNFHNIEQAAKGTQYQKLANAWAQTNNPVYLKALKNAVVHKRMIGNLNEEWKKIQQRLNEKNASAISSKYVKNAKSREGWESFVAYEMMLNEANAILKKKETNSFASSQQSKQENQQRAASIAAVEKLIKEANSINRVLKVGTDTYPENTQKRLYATKKERIKELLSQMNLAKLNTINWVTLPNNIVNLITVRRKNLRSGNSLNTSESYKQAQIQELRNQLPKNLNAATRQKMASIEVDGTSNEKLAFYKKLLENLEIRVRNIKSSEGAQSTLNVKLKINAADTVATLNTLRSDAEARNLKQYFNKKRADIFEKEKLENLKRRRHEREQTAASVAEYKKLILGAKNIKSIEQLKTNSTYTGDAKTNINTYANAVIRKMVAKGIENANTVEKLEELHGHANNHGLKKEFNNKRETFNVVPELPKFGTRVRPARNSVVKEAAAAKEKAVANRAAAVKLLGGIISEFKKEYPNSGLKLTYNEKNSSLNKLDSIRVSIQKYRQEMIKQAAQQKEAETTLTLKRSRILKKEKENIDKAYNNFITDTDLVKLVSNKNLNKPEDLLKSVVHGLLPSAPLATRMLLLRKIQRYIHASNQPSTNNTLPKFHANYLLYKGNPTGPKPEVNGPNYENLNSKGYKWSGYENKARLMKEAQNRINEEHKEARLQLWAKLVNDKVDTFKIENGESKNVRAYLIKQYKGNANLNNETKMKKHLESIEVSVPNPVRHKVNSGPHATIISKVANLRKTLSKIPTTNKTRAQRKKRTKVYKLKGELRKKATNAGLKGNFPNLGK
jgi:hypothetical protein